MSALAYVLWVIGLAVVVSIMAIGFVGLCMCAHEESKWGRKGYNPAPREDIFPDDPPPTPPRGGTGESHGLPRIDTNVPMPPVKPPRDRRTVWIVGKWVEGHEAAWEFQGVFETEAEAVRCCIDRTYFVAPATMGEPRPDERHEWEGCYYPLAND